VFGISVFFKSQKHTSNSFTFWIDILDCHLPGQAVHICKPAEHLANAIHANPVLLPRTKNSRQVNLGLQFGKCQVNFAKHLEITCFSPPHFVSGVGKLQQMAKKNVKLLEMLIQYLH